jgi:cytochrome c
MRAVLKGLLFGLFAMTLSHAALAASDKGSADEAIALVKTAVNYVKANDKEKAYAEFNNNKGQFIDRDLYIFVFDMTGKTLAHGTNPRRSAKT